VASLTSFPAASAGTAASPAEKAACAGRGGWPHTCSNCPYGLRTS
jgi:hypothetical protein